MNRQERQAKAAATSFDGGAWGRTGTPAPSDPVREHNALILALLRPGYMPDYERMMRLRNPRGPW
jgi:hypothetical protein